MDTDYLYLGLSETELYDCIHKKSKVRGEILRPEDCKDEFTDKATTNFFPRTCCTKQKKLDKREPGLLKEEFRGTEMLYLCNKTFFCYDSKSNNIKLSSKGLNRRTLEDCKYGPIAKYRKVWFESNQELLFYPAA